MEDVRIYDFDFSLLHIEHDIHSVNWHLLGNDIGSFEMHFSLQSRLSALLEEHRYLVAVQGDKQAVITGRELSDEGVLYGRTTNWLLDRFCLGADVDTDALFEEGRLPAKDAATVCRYLLEQGMGHVSDLSFGDCEEELSQVSFSGRAEDSVFSAVRSVLEQAFAGHRLVFSPQKHLWVFEIFRGKTLSRALSEDNKNAYDTGFTANLQDCFTGGYYRQEMSHQGDWDPVENEPPLSNGKPENYAKSYRVALSAGDSYQRFGITFYEGDYVFSKDPAGTLEKGERPGDFLVHLPSDKEGIYAWECGLSATNEQEARKLLSEKKEEKKLRLSPRSFRYGKDYGLLDRVLCKVQKGAACFSEYQRVCGVRLWYEDSGVGEEVEFMSEE